MISAREVLEELAENSELSLEVFTYLQPILEAVVELTPEEESQYKDTIAAFVAGLEGLRDELGMPWDVMPMRRVKQLGTQIADFAADWSVYDSYLAGTFLAASARMQLRMAQGQPAGEPEEDPRDTLLAAAASGNENLKARVDQLEPLEAQAEKVRETARGVVAGTLPPSVLVQLALALGKPS